MNPSDLQEIGTEADNEFRGEKIFQNNVVHEIWS